MKTPAQYISERKAAGETAGEREEGSRAGERGGSGEEEMERGSPTVGTPPARGSDVPGVHSEKGCSRLTRAAGSDKRCWRSHTSSCALVVAGVA